MPKELEQKLKIGAKKKGFSGKKAKHVYGTIAKKTGKKKVTYMS